MKLMKDVGSASHYVKIIKHNLRIERKSLLYSARLYVWETCAQEGIINSHLYAIINSHLLLFFLERGSGGEEGKNNQKISLVYFWISKWIPVSCIEYGMNKTIFFRRSIC